MYDKYRLYVFSARGTFFAASSNTVNDLVDLVRSWLQNTPDGRSVVDLYDPKGRLEYSDARGVALYTLDPDTGAYVISKQVPATDRADIIKKTHALGGR